MAPAERPVSTLFDPCSAVVIGASSDPAKWGGLVAEKLLRGERRRPVYLVNRSGAEIFGRRSYRSVAGLPEAPEFAAITVPRAAFAAAVDDALAAGVKAIVGMTTGFGETGVEGAALQASVVSRVREAGGVLLGPNCMGVYDSSVAFDCLPWAEPPEGTLGIVSQSGSLIMDLARRAYVYGLGVSRAASIGNQADVTIADLVASLAAHEHTDVIAIYCEDVRNGRALFEAIEQAVSSGTPVVILAPSANPAASRAANSHTGALLSDGSVMRAACRASGAVLVDSIRAMAEAVHAVRSPLRARARRTAIATDAGGFAVLGAGAAVAAGLEVPVFSKALEAELSELSLSGTGLHNPVDIVGLVKVDEFVPVLELLLHSGEVDCVLANIVVFNSDSPESERSIGAQLAAVASASGKPMAVATPDLDNRGVDALRDGGIPVFADIEVAAAALAMLCRERAPSLSRSTEPARTLPQGAVSYFGARRLLAEHGIPFAPGEEVASLGEALDAAERIGYPIVLKALGTLHKSDLGGVALDLTGPDALRESFEEMRGRLDPTSFAIERMITHTDSTELIIGGRNDSRFGPVVLVGAGGVFAEVLADTAVALAPVNHRQAEELVLGLQTAPLLEGARGRPPADVAAVADVVVAVSRVLCTYTEIGELDVNPVIVSPSGALALDARIVRVGES